MPIRLVLADDHPLILEGLENLFRMEADFQLLATCGDAVSALEAVRKHAPDILVLDLRMPGGGGLALARKIQQAALSPRIVVFTAALDDDELVEAVCLGIKGIVLKEMSSQHLIQCIRKVHAGEQWIERRSARLALDKMLQRESTGRELAGILTPREIDLARLVAQGLRNREIADRLCISEGTVKVHLSNIYEKLKLDGRVALLRYAQEKGLV
ncbi:MAG TPA: response regulator transcription factor [Geobacteraceae bacterium]